MSMPPDIPILAQSESKAKFLERLGLSDDTAVRIYAMMKEEAIAGRARMSASPHSLLPHLVNDPTVRPPYSNTQISESAMHEETLYIYRSARPETRAYYDRGHYIEGDMEENWIIKWLLWHVFRYRDSRNRGRGAPSWMPRASSTPVTPVEASSAAGSGHFVPHSFGSTAGSSFPSHTDARASASAPSVVQADRTAQSGEEREDVTDSSRPTSTSQSQGYWDPVRDAHRTNNEP